MSNGQNITPEWDQLALEVGRFMRYWGFKVIHGRIWTHIYLSQTPLDAGTLIERFKLSKALMSLSLHDLLRSHVILEGPKSPKGTQTYVANPEVLNVILNVLKRREKPMLAEIKAAHERLTAATQARPEDSQVHPARLNQLGQMIHQAQVTLEAILEVSHLDLRAWRIFNEKT